MIDLIGDVHGHANELEALLRKLGYAKKDGAFTHPDRKVIFVGDYIDRGPQIRETLAIVRAMVDRGDAIALMGNHEYNALCFDRKATGGGHLRPHTIKNIIQHKETLHQFQNRQKEYQEYLEWFKTLPLFYEGDHFRVVHACWDHANVDFLKTKLDNHCLTEDLIRESVKEDTELHQAIGETLKGKEIKLPEGYYFNDKDGTKRDEIRIKWWEDPKAMTYQSISVEPIPQLPVEPIDLTQFRSNEFYSRKEPPVFFGHYWLKGEPLPYKTNVCCLDYSVAKGGKLVAYSLDGEEALDESKLTYV